VERALSVLAGTSEVFLCLAFPLERVGDPFGRVLHAPGAVLSDIGLPAAGRCDRVGDILSGALLVADRVLHPLGGVTGNTGRVATGVVDGALRVLNLPGRGPDRRRRPRGGL